MTQPAESAGSLVEESVRLLHALGGWVQERSAESPHGDHAGGQRPASERSECRWCPVCRLLAGIRVEQPELVDSVAAIGAGVAAALRELFDAVGAEPPPPSATRRAGGVQHIHIG